MGWYYYALLADQNGNCPNIGGTPLVQALNTAGSKGWELATSFATPNGSVHILKHASAGPAVTMESPFEAA